MYALYKEYNLGYLDGHKLPLYRPVLAYKVILDGLAAVRTGRGLC